MGILETLNRKIIELNSKLMNFAVQRQIKNMEKQCMKPESIADLNISKVEKEKEDEFIEINQDFKDKFDK